MKERVTGSAHSGNQDKAFCKMSYSEMKIAQTERKRLQLQRWRNAGKKTLQYCGKMLNSQEKISASIFACIHIERVSVFLLIS